MTSDRASDLTIKGSPQKFSGNREVHGYAPDLTTLGHAKQPASAGNLNSKWVVLSVLMTHQLSGLFATDILHPEPRAGQRCSNAGPANAQKTVVIALISPAGDGGAWPARTNRPARAGFGLARVVQAIRFRPAARPA